MARSYVLNHLHCVFSNKNRAQLIRDPRALWDYMRGIARNCGFSVLAIGGTENHVHVLLSVPAKLTLLEIMRDLKANSSRFMKERVAGFSWQDGYSALSVSPSQVGIVKRYIANQAEHHSRQPFDAKYLALLKKAGVTTDRDEALG